MSATIGPVALMRQTNEEKKTMAKRNYYTLLTRDWKGDAWAIDFGSYVRSEVVAEKQDHKDHGRPNWSLLIIVTGDTQQEIAAEVVRLNSGGVTKDDILNSRNVE